MAPITLRRIKHTITAEMCARADDTLTGVPSDLAAAR
jgi:hypothetical protein